jgi:hypothetical protein
MKLSDLNLNENSEKGYKMKILHPYTDEPMLKDDKKTPQTITVCGIDSDRFKSADKAQKNKQLQKGRKGRPTAEKLMSQDLDTLVACVIAWDVELHDTEEQNKFNAKNLRMTLEENTFIYDQVNSAIADRSNFLDIA